MLQNWQKINFSGTAALMALALVGCGSSPHTPPTGAASNAAKVVVTTGVLCDLTEKIAQTTIAITCLVKAGQDPHTYQPQPEDRKAIETANLILYGGYNHEPTLLKLIQSTSNPVPKIAIYEKAIFQPLMGKEHHHSEGKKAASPDPDPTDADHSEDHKEADNDHGDDHTTGATVPDPHVWHNAQNGVRMVAALREELTKLVPSHAEQYSRNAQKLTDKLQKIDAWIKVQIATIPVHQRQLITTHDALGYYANAYGLEVVGVLQGVSTEEQPTAARIAKLAADIKSAGVPTIFTETTVNPKLIQAVAREANVKISDQSLYSDGLGERGTPGDTYTGMLMANTCAITEGLGGKCTPFPSQATP